MQWLHDLIFTDSIAHTLAILAFAIFPGIVLGNRSFFGIKIGIAGVLFSGLAVGASGLPVDEHTLHFIREFGLILFVFAVGLQVGPGFFANFREQGIRLNFYALCIVSLSFLIAISIQKIFHVPIEAMVGILSGAVTNTPGLGAAQQALKDIPSFSPDALAISGSGYAVAYPFGIFGIILTMIMVRLFFKIQISDEANKFSKTHESDGNRPHTFSVEVTNPLLWGKPIHDVEQLVKFPVVFSRLFRLGQVIIPKESDTLLQGDILQVVCNENDLHKITTIVGNKSSTDIRLLPGNLETRKILVSSVQVGSLLLSDLRIQERFSARITRVLRSGIEFVPSMQTKLHIGDLITVVGSTEHLHLISQELGDSRTKLEHANFLPIFLGVFLGVILGSIPIAIPGLPAPVKLGMAGGPLLIALLMGFKRKLGPIQFFMPASAIHFMREMGILLFLSVVGLLSGTTFVDALIHGNGLYWMLAGAAITLVPIVIVGVIARLRGLNYLTLAGLLAGAMTDPPALGYANSLNPSQAQSVAYASVYPFTMFLRVLAAQLFVMLLSM